MLTDVNTREVVRLGDVRYRVLLAMREHRISWLMASTSPHLAASSMHFHGIRACKKVESIRLE
jgi:hypothetical protein